MGFHHRKFLTELCDLICHGKESVSNCSSNKSDCTTVCFKICLPNPQYPFFNYPPPPSSPPQQPSDENNNHKLTNYYILTLSLVAFIFFLFCIRAIYMSRIKRRLRAVTRTRASPSSASAPSTIQQIDENFDENQHVVDHPIWYIRTLGLNQSVINTISVYKYKKGEGLIDGTECSVCLSEFEEDENLRLLPKCNHAFHLPCIDTWLRSHTNCPMCRAPIVNGTNPPIARVESLEPVIVVDSSSTSSSLEHTQIEVFDENSGDGETNLGFESCDFDSESRNRVAAEEEGEGQIEVFENERRVVDAVSVVRPRRSVSMDDSFVANINNALANVLSIESKGNGESSRVICNEEDAISKVNGNENLATTSKGSSSFSIRSTRYLQGVPSPMKRSSSYNGKFRLSWYSRNQKKPNAILRNF